MKDSIKREKKEFTHSSEREQIRPKVKLSIHHLKFYDYDKAK